MARPTFEELRQRRLNTMSANERAEFDAALAVARLAMEVGEKVRDAREAAGLTQRDLAARMSTSQAAVARLGGRRYERHAHDSPQGRGSYRYDGHGQSGSGAVRACRDLRRGGRIDMTVTVNLAPAR